MKEKRSVSLDGCVQWLDRVLQLEQAGQLKQVEVWQRWDRSIEVLGDGRRLKWTALSVEARGSQEAQAQKADRKPIANIKVHKPTGRQRISLNDADRPQKDPRRTCRRPGE